MANLANEEKETIIIFNESEKTADIFTYNKKLKSKLEKLLKKELGGINYVKDNGDGGLSYVVPKDWINVNPPRKRTLSEKQKQQARVQIKIAREKKLLKSKI